MARALLENRQTMHLASGVRLQCHADGGSHEQQLATKSERAAECWYQSRGIAQAMCLATMVSALVFVDHDPGFPGRVLD